MTRPTASTSAALTSEQKAAVLVEALPWLQRFAGAVVVVKYGGNAMVDDDLKAAFAADVAFLRAAGLRPVVVHGGGPQISAMLGRLGIASDFRGGLRVTTRRHFVEQHHLRFHREGPGDGNPLLLTARQFCRIGILLVHKSDAGKELARSRDRRFTLLASHIHGCFDYISKCRHMRKQIEVLENHPDAGAEYV